MGRMMKRTMMNAVLLTVACLSLSVPASARPDYSGVWKLDYSKSYLGPMADQKTMVLDVTHDDPRLIVTSRYRLAGREESEEMRLLTQGEEMVFVLNGKETRGHALWFGDHLFLTTTQPIAGIEAKIEELWTLSADGRTLRIHAVVTTPKGREELLGVFEKQ